MNDRRPYGDDPYPRRSEPSNHGRHSAHEDPGERRGVPTPRQPSGGNGQGPAQKRPRPPQQSAPYHDNAPNRARSAPSNPGAWEEDESTRMIGKLGFVPPEARSFDPDDRFNLDSLHEGDGTKVRARKRAKKASPLAKTGGILAAVLVIGLIAGGIYMLTTGDETESDNALTYAAMDKPCTPLDTSALDDIASGNATPSIESSKTIGSKTEQTCAVSLGAEAGTGVDVEVSSTVFSRDAGARNEFKHESEDSEEVANESKIYTVTNDIGDGAFTVSRPWADDTGSSDFSLYFYDANAFVHVRVTIYSSTEVSDDDVSARAHKIANAYMTAWKG